MSLGLLNEDMEMLNNASELIDKLVSASPESCIQAEFCYGDCEHSCKDKCADNH